MDHAGPPNLLPLVTTRLAQAREDPFGNPVLSAALAINRMIDEGDLTIATITSLVRQLRDTAFADRARRLSSYLGGTEPNLSRAALSAIAEKILSPDPLDSPIPWPNTTPARNAPATPPSSPPIPLSRSPRRGTTPSRHWERMIRRSSTLTVRHAPLAWNRSLIAPELQSPTAETHSTN